MMSLGVLNLPRLPVLDWAFGHSLISCHVEHHLFPWLSDNMCLKVGGSWAGGLVMKGLSEGRGQCSPGPPAGLVRGPLKASPVHQQRCTFPITDLWVPYSHCDSGQVNRMSRSLCFLAWVMRVSSACWQAFRVK